MKKILAILFAAFFLGIAAAAGYAIHLSSNLPKLITVEDYKPLLVTEVFDRGEEKIGEFFREHRTLVPYEKIPPLLVKAFIAAEDDQFFEHGGINYTAIFRAMIANIKAGRTVQGGSTITQQVAKTLLLKNPEKTILRKVKEALLSYRMEAHLSKEDILYLYLNQIYLGQGAYGVHAAAQTYYRKKLEDLTIGEMAVLAGLPQAPSRYSPIRNPIRAKERQRYVLTRMKEVGFITEEQKNQEIQKPVSVFVRKNYRSIAPFYLETIRQLLVKELGEQKVLDEGLRIYTGLDSQKQEGAQKALRKGLRELDKRQGYRGASQNIKDPKKIAEFLLKTKRKIISDLSPLRIIQPDGKMIQPALEQFEKKQGEKTSAIPKYIKVDDITEGVVTDVNDEWGYVKVRFAEGQGLIDFESMNWARKPDPAKHFAWDKIKKPSQALSTGDVILVKVIGDSFYSNKITKKLKTYKNRPESLPDFSQFAQLELEQEPKAESALISFDLKTQEIVSLVGGYDFSRSEFNRTIQSQRQTGSAFKAIVYTAALDKGYTPSSKIVDAPIVYEEEKIIETESEEGIEQESIVTKWKPKNYSKKFGGDILFRNALIRSMNVPTIKILNDIGIEWVADYARRLGIFSPLNMDMTLGLGSSGVTLYEMTKVFSHLANQGKRLKPLLIRRVEDRKGNILIENMSLDKRFETEISQVEREYEKRRMAYLNWEKGQLDRPQRESATADNENPNVNPTVIQDPEKNPPFFFEDEEQLIKPTTAYLITSLLHSVVHERKGTGGKARVLGRPLAGKTGTTNDYYDGWFMGFSPHISTGVWVGFDEEKRLGVGEAGGRAALPIWIDYMRVAHEGMPKTEFSAPEGIVFANIDNDTGKLASAGSNTIVRQAFEEGSEPTTTAREVEEDDETRFLKEDLSE